jgi:membrane associated rhomboid family serine protease
VRAVPAALPACMRGAAQRTLTHACALRRALTRVMVVNLLLGAASPNIDNWAHLGGLAGGALLAFVCGPNLVWEGRRLVDRPLLRLPS